MTAAAEQAPIPVMPPRVWGAWPVVRPVGGGRVWIWGLLSWLALAPLTYLPPRLSGNVFSRYMTIEAIVERGTLAIERSPLLLRSGSPDVVKFGPHLYSDKPPVLPVLAAPLYGALRARGIRFAGPIDQFVLANFVLTWGSAGVAMALGLVAFRGLLQCVDLAPWLADLATIALGATSPLLTYAVTFNNHSVAAGCVLGAWAFTLRAGSGRRAVAAGLLAGFAATIDLPVGCLTLAGLGLIHLVRGGAATLRFAAGAAGPLALHAGLQTLVTGSPLPAEMYPAAFEYPGSYWTTPEGTFHETGPRWRFGLDLLVGRQGAFTVFPALWLGLVGLAGALGGPRERRPAAVLITGTLAVLVAYYVWGVRRTDFAGASFGVRHLLAIEPLVFLFAIEGLSRTHWRRLGGVLGAGVLTVGGIYALAGMADPWSRVERRVATNPWLRAVDAAAPYRAATFRDGLAPPREPR